MEEKKRIDITEKEITTAKGGATLILVLLGYAVDIAVMVAAIILLAAEISEVGGGILLVLSMIFLVVMIILST